jgi:energy-coupling factor transporter transmembrane protein EcfT
MIGRVRRVSRVTFAIIARAFRRSATSLNSADVRGKNRGEHEERGGG